MHGLAAPSGAALPLGITIDTDRAALWGKLHQRPPLQFDSTIPTIRSAAMRARTTHTGATRRVWLSSFGGGSAGPVDPVGVRLFTVGPAGFVRLQVLGAWTVLNHGRRGPRAHMYSLSSASQGMFKPSARGEQDPGILLRGPRCARPTATSGTAHWSGSGSSRPYHPRVASGHHQHRQRARLLKLQRDRCRRKPQVVLHPLLGAHRWCAPTDPAAGRRAAARAPER